MNQPSLATSYAACRRVVRAANSNFPLAFRFLPADQHRGMDALYAWLRLVDDVADGEDDILTKREELRAIRTRRDRKGADSFAPLRSRLVEEIEPALNDTIACFHIPERHLLAVLDGVESDLSPQSFVTFADLRVYCERVASAVGLACLSIWGVTDPRAEEPAIAAGIAFQLTNILRDLGEDRARGRDYLPRDESSKPLKFQIERARQFYRHSDALVPLLPPPGRRMFLLMRSIYEALLEEIARDPPAVLTRRVRVPRWKKAKLLCQAILARSSTMSTSAS